MTNGLDQALVNAVFGLLQADNLLTTFDGYVPPNTSAPYVVVYTTVNYPSGDIDNSLDGRSQVIASRFYCHCVGGSAAGARAVAQRVRTQLLDQRPVANGLTFGMIREVPGPPAPLRDEQTGTLLIDSVVVFELRAST